MPVSSGSGYGGLQSGQSLQSSAQQGSSKALPASFSSREHWEPDPEDKSAHKSNHADESLFLSLTHGDMVEVTWMDDIGLAFGRKLDAPDEDAGGYFPQRILRPVTWPPQTRCAGESVECMEAFSSPGGGYLSLEVGDVVCITFVEKPGVWMFGKNSKGTEGWFPEAVVR